MATRLAADHPERAHAAVLVDGGLTPPGTEHVRGIEPQSFVEAFIGPALDRLKMRFPSGDAYLDWWRAHPAIASGDVADADLAAYAQHDLIGEAPELRSSVNDPDPTMPLVIARAWADAAPGQRQVHLVEGSNHYSLVFGAAGAAALADSIAAHAEG